MNIKLIAITVVACALAIGCDKPPNVTSDSKQVQAVPFHGQVYRSIDGMSVLTLISEDECELLQGGTTLLCKYTKQADALRVVVTVMGTNEVKYYRLNDQGIQDNNGAVLFSPERYTAAQQSARLIPDSDKEIDNANKYWAEAQPLFQRLLNDVDNNGLPDVRAKEKETANKASVLFGKASEAFRIAAQKLEQARQIGTEKKNDHFLTLKIKSYGLIDQGAEANKEIIRLVFDSSIPDMASLMPKITEMANRRDELQKEASKVSDEANTLTLGQR